MKSNNIHFPCGDLYCFDLSSSQPDMVLPKSERRKVFLIVTKEQLINALVEYPEKLGESLKIYHQHKREAEQLEAQLVEKSSWSNDGLLSHKSEEYIQIEQKLAGVKKSIDAAEETIAVLQAQFDANRIIATATLYTH